jgi:uncharacterized protein (TIGR03382 family)
VLTAAHCVDPEVLGFTSQDQVTASLTVHFSTVDVVHDPGNTIAASATFKDPLFNRAHLGTNDLGLVELESPVTDVTPSVMNLAAADAPVGTMVTMVGYGSTERGAQGSIGIQFELRGRTSTGCPGLGIGSDANLLCFSQKDNRGTCQGDSGGPAFAIVNGKPLIVGVTSFGDQQCAEFGADTRIDVEQPFLVAHVPDLVGCTDDRDCPAHRSCFARKCIAAPFGPSGIGTVCTTAADCDSSQCAESSLDGKRCSMTCSVSDGSSCPDGFECLPAKGDLGACWPSSGGCCDAGGAGGPGSIALGLGVAMLAWRRRRR